MPAMQPSRSAPKDSSPWFRLSRRAWWWVVAAVAVGALLFLLLVLGQRDARDLRAAGDPAPDGRGRVLAPLPAPGANGTGTGTGDLMRPGQDLARVVDPVASWPSSPPPPPPEPAAPRPPAPPPSTATTAPVAIATPAPHYPVSALRRGQSGEVLLRIEVDPYGMPYAMDIVRSSGSRELDRAALVAARGWRFRPALRDGQPVSAMVQVPIRFDRD
ncbi:hypothetical protein BH23PSE2_BH23PSE2_04680 [soil metagenome]